MVLSLLWIIYDVFEVHVFQCSIFTHYHWHFYLVAWLVWPRRSDFCLLFVLLLLCFPFCGNTEHYAMPLKAKSQNISWTNDTNMQIWEFMSSSHLVPYILYMRKLEKINLSSSTWNDVYILMYIGINIISHSSGWAILSNVYTLIARIWDFRHFCEEDE